MLFISLGNSGASVYHIQSSIFIILTFIGYKTARVLFAYISITLLIIPSKWEKSIIFSLPVLDIDVESTNSLID